MLNREAVTERSLPGQLALGPSSAHARRPGLPPDPVVTAPPHRGPGAGSSAQSWPHSECGSGSYPQIGLGGAAPHPSPGARGATAYIPWEHLLQSKHACVTFSQKPQEGHLRADSLNGVICSDSGDGSGGGTDVGMAAVCCPDVFRGKAAGDGARVEIMVLLTGTTGLASRTTEGNYGPHDQGLF